MKKVLIILNIAGLLGSLIWLMFEKSWEPLVTCLGLISSLIVLINSTSNSDGNIDMKQKGGKNSKNYQSSGNMTINKKND